MIERLSIAEYKAAVKAAKPKRNKFHALPDFRCESCGAGADQRGRCAACGAEDVVRFDSRAEARRYDLLRSMERGGMIRDLERQVKLELHAPGGALIGRLVVDFRYRAHDGRIVHEDVKGGRATDTKLSKWKRRHAEAELGIIIELPGR